MKAYRIVLSVIDFEELGEEGIKRVIESTRFPNDCINPHVQAINCADIGDWHDGHPLNKASTAKADFTRLFAELEARTPAATDIRNAAGELVAIARKSCTPAIPVVAEGLIEALLNIRDYRTDVDADVAARSMRFYAEQALAAHPVAGSPAEAEPDALDRMVSDMSAEDRAEVEKIRAELRAMPIEEVAKMVRGTFVNVGAAEPMPASEAPKLPNGWVALNIFFDDDMDYPEEVAYGPPAMMERLRKKLDKYYADIIAKRDAAPVPASEAANVVEGYVLALQTVVEMPDGKKELGYTLLDGVGIFTSEQEVSAAIAEMSLPLGWVIMKTSQLLPGWMLPAAPAAPTDAKPLPDAVHLSRDLARRCLSSMKHAVTFGETGRGRPPSQTCLFEIEELEAILQKRPATVMSAQSVRDALEQAYEHAAKTIELFDDKTMEADYMLDAGECAGIIRALKPSAIRALIQSPQPGEA